MARTAAYALSVSIALAIALARAGVPASEWQSTITLDVCGQALVADGDGAALSLMQRRAGLTSHAALLARARVAVQVARREAMEGGGPELSVDEARALAMEALGGAGRKILGDDWVTLAGDEGESQPRAQGEAARERDPASAELRAVVEAGDRRREDGREDAGAEADARESADVDEEGSRRKGAKAHGRLSEAGGDEAGWKGDAKGKVAGDDEGDELESIEADDLATVDQKAQDRKLILQKVEAFHEVGHKKSVLNETDQQRTLLAEHEKKLGSTDSTAHLAINSVDAKHRTERRKAEAEAFLLPDNVSFAATSSGRVYPLRDESSRAAASEMWGNWHISENRTEPPPPNPQAAMLSNAPAANVSPEREAELQAALADFRDSKDLVGPAAAQAAHRLLSTAAAAAAEASGRLQRFTKHEGVHCTGSELDLLSAWSGTHDECAEKCIELGPSCTGFVRVADTGSPDPAIGRCFFRSGDVARQKHQTSECYVRRYHVHRGESCGWGPTMAASCGWPNQLNISFDGGRSTSAPVEEEQVCGDLCDAHPECGGFNYHNGTCFYRRSTTCGEVLHRDEDTACYTKVHSTA